MTPIQAIELLDKAAQSAVTDRQGHLNLMEAIRVISEALKDKEEQV